MKSHGSGSIINLSAAVATHPTPYSGAYVAPKGFVTNLRPALDSELRTHGVRVSAVQSPAGRTSAGGAGKADSKATLVHKLFPTIGHKPVARAITSAARSPVGDRRLGYRHRDGHRADQPSILSKTVSAGPIRLSRSGRSSILTRQRHSLKRPGRTRYGAVNHAVQHLRACRRRWHHRAWRDRRGDRRGRRSWWREARRVYTGLPCRDRGSTSEITLTLSPPPFG
jgi:hypothetical protein